MAEEAKVYTFYHEFLCSGCRTVVAVPIQKKARELPERHRERWVNLAESGEKLLWPMNPSEDEVNELAQSTTCPKGHTLRSKDFVWPLGAG